MDHGHIGKDYIDFIRTIETRPGALQPGGLAVWDIEIRVGSPPATARRWRVRKPWRMRLAARRRAQERARDA
jgi:hypothetical protein